MQKLVKKTRHYQTLVPVEAYQGEEGDWKDEISLVITLAGCASSWNPAGQAVCIAGLAAAGYYHEPTREFAQDVMEANTEQTFQRIEGQADLVDDIIGVGQAIVDGVEAIGDALDNSDPVAQPPVVPDDAITGRHLH